MKNKFEKKAGLSLIIFTVLMVFTMVLHPAGGSVEHLINITNIIIITHSIAILSLPFGWVGFWGLTRKIGTDQFGAILGLAMVSLGMVAVLIAAAANGLVLPFFLQHYKEAAPEDISAIKPLLRYNFEVNHAFDYIYTGAFCLAILCWSLTILGTRKMAAWIGWLGIIISLVVMAIFIFGMTPNNLQGLRLFISGIVVWILLTGIRLYKE